MAYAALEEVTVDEALERMRVYRPVLGGWHPGRYPGTDPARLVELAAAVLEGTAPKEAG